MKKITAIILALAITLFALTLAACGEKPAGDSSTPVGNEPTTAGPNNNAEDSVYATVAKAIENTLKAKSYDANISTLLKTNLMGNLSEKTIAANVKATALDTAAPKIGVSGTRTEDGYTGDHNMYYDGEWKYFNVSPEEGYKSRCTLEQFAAEAGVPQGVIVTLPEALFANAQSKKNDDGSLTVNLTADEATIETLYKAAITAIVYDVVGEDLSQSVTKDAAIEVTVADGYVREYKVSYVCEITAGGDTVTYDSSNTVTYVSCGKDVTVNPPANADGFYEIDGY